MRAVGGWHHLEPTLTIDLFEDGIHLVAIGVIHRPDTIRLCVPKYPVFLNLLSS